MNLKVKTPCGTVSAAYLYDSNDNAIGIHAGIYDCISAVSLEYSARHGGLCLIINHDELDRRGIKLVSMIGGWNGREMPWE